MRPFRGRRQLPRLAGQYPFQTQTRLYGKLALGCRVHVAAKLVPRRRLGRPRHDQIRRLPLRPMAPLDCKRNREHAPQLGKNGYRPGDRCPRPKLQGLGRPLGHDLFAHVHNAVSQCRLPRLLAAVVQPQVERLRLVVVHDVADAARAQGPLHLGPRGVIRCLLAMLQLDRIDEVFPAAQRQVVPAGLEPPGRRQSRPLRAGRALGLQGNAELRISTLVVRVAPAGDFP